jgi:hypothetical protein
MPLPPDVESMMQQNETMRKDIQTAIIRKCMDDVVMAIEELGVNGIDITNLLQIKTFIHSELSPVINELKLIRLSLITIAGNTKKTTKKKAEVQK